MKKHFERGDLWFGFARIAFNKKGKRVVRLVYGRVLSVMAGLGLAGWVILTLAGFFFVRFQMDFKEGSYWDVVFPFRWDHYRASLGDSHVEKARDALAEQNFRSFELYLRRGVAHSPGNLEGRKLLAELDLWRNDPSRAAATLARGMEFDHALEDAEYLNFALRVYLAAERDEDIHALRDTFLARSTPPELLLPVLLASTQAYYLRGDLESAAQLIEKHELTGDLSGLLLQLRIAWDQGQREDVLDAVDELLRQQPSNEVLLQLKLRFLFEAGRYRDAENTAVLYALRHPHNSVPHIFHLTILARQERWEEMQNRYRALLQRFQRDPTAMQQLVNVATQFQRVEITSLILENAESSGRNLPIALLGHWENAMHAGDMLLARRLSLRILEEVELFEEPALAARKAALLVGWHVLNNADTDATNATNALLRHLFRHPEVVLRIAPILEAERQWTILNRLLTEAHRLHPTQTPFVGRMIEVAMARNDYPEVTRRLEQYLKMRGPEASLLAEIEQFLSSDRFLYLEHRREALEQIRAQRRELPI